MLDVGGSSLGAGSSPTAARWANIQHPRSNIRVLALKSLRISQVGLRGVVGAGLTAAHVIDFAAAFGTFLDSQGAVIIGRDPRSSGVMMREGVISGLLACGHDVIDLGIAPTPVIQHAINRLQAAGGISIGASHNASEWNALKFIGVRGSYLSTAESEELLDIYHLKKFLFVDWARIGKLCRVDDAIDRYLDELASVYDFDSLRAAPLPRRGGLLQRNLRADLAAPQ